MAHFSWTDDLHTGSSLIDGDHARLIDLINALFEIMGSSEDSARMGEAMDELIAYAEEHFGREEEQMQRIQYVATLAHRSEHAKLLRQVTELKAMLDAGAKINTPAVSEFLDEWLRHHILTADMKLAAALNAHGRSAPAPRPH